MTSSITRPLAGQISVWIQDRVREAGAKGLVLGMSGGIDSSVVATLSKMACGNNVLAMIMPCHSSPQSATHAQMVASKLNIKTHVSDLTAAYDSIVQKIPHAEGFELTNVRPRLRMTALYCAAQANNYLVIGTTNRTESTIGYFTKWGDGASDLLPLANLYKDQVYALAHEIDIPEEIITKEPTADLWEGQTDEKEIGMTYTELETILRGIDMDNLSGLNPDSVERVRKMIELSAHKRNPVPVFMI